MTDWRLPGTRRELFQRFYSFHLKYRSHPGGVYYVLPYLADKLGWDEEQRAWAAWINGNTQNPVTTLMLMEAGDRPSRADAMLNWFCDNITELSWDTDRRYHRKPFVASTLGYLNATGSRGQVGYWQHAAQQGWPGVWEAANALPRMARLSSWSYLEYLRVLGVGDVPDADNLALEDIWWSRSHRNGLALVAGRDDLVWWRDSPHGFQKVYTPDVRGYLDGVGASLLDEARRRNPGNPDVSYLTLESALCTFKSWHVPNRRYAGVYNDMLHDRLRHAESRHGHRFGIIWDARAAHLPVWLRLEDNPDDPGCVPVKQNHFLDTGQPPVIGHEYPDLLSDFDRAVPTGIYRKERKWA